MNGDGYTTTRAYMCIGLAVSRHAKPTRAPTEELAKCLNSTVRNWRC